MLLHCWHGSSIYSAHYLFPVFLSTIANVSMPNFLPQICTIYCSYQIFAKNLNVIHIHQGINLLKWFGKLVLHWSFPMYVVEWHDSSTISVQSEPPWKMLLWIFTSATIFLPPPSPSSYSFLCYLRCNLRFCWIFLFFQTLYYRRFWGSISETFLKSTCEKATFLRFVLSSLRMF